jgi:predicted anti-sigma-YlaC factor YlaD
MDCKKAQPLFDDLSQNRLDSETAVRVRQHLTDCTDCRVLAQRAARLQRLLALKCYERPVPEYLDNFLSEFHSRLMAETQRAAWWERALGRIDSLLVVGTMRVWRYGVASAMGVAVVVGVMWMSVRQTNAPDSAADQTAAANPSLVLADLQATPSPSHSAPDALVAPVPASLQAVPGDYQPTTAGSVDMVQTTTRADYTAPRYVLDSIAVTPASYEVSSFHF